MKKYGRLLAAAVCAAACALASPAEAVERHGLVIGFSVGGGAITCDGCDSLASLGADFHLGGMIGDRIAVLAEGYALTHPENGGTFASGLGGGAIQVWPSDSFWVKGGLGVGQIEVTQGKFSVSSDSAFAVLAATGVELVRGDKFVLDLQGRFSSTFFEGGAIRNFSAHIGFNWY